MCEYIKKNFIVRDVVQWDGKPIRDSNGKNSFYKILTINDSGDIGDPYNCCVYSDYKFIGSKLHMFHEIHFCDGISKIDYCEDIFDFLNNFDLLIETKNYLKSFHDEI